MTFHPDLLHGLTVAIGWNPAGTYTGDPRARRVTAVRAHA